MPTEDELRTLLRREQGAEPRLDADVVIRRARARRRPKRIAAGALGGLAAVALVVPVAVGLGSQGSGSLSASDEAGSLAAGADSAEQDNRVLQQDLHASCQPPLHEGDPAPAGVTLTLTQEASGGAIVLTLVNGSADPLTGTLPSSPAVLLARDGVIIGTARTELELSALDLVAGQQTSVSLPFQAVDCAGAPLEAGSYEADAVFAIQGDDGAMIVIESGFAPVVVAAAQ